MLLGALLGRLVGVKSRQPHFIPADITTVSRGLIFLVTQHYNEKVSARAQVGRSACAKYSGSGQAGHMQHFSALRGGAAAER